MIMAAAAMLVYACVSPVEQGLLSTTLYKCPAPPVTASAVPEVLPEPAGSPQRPVKSRTQRPPLILPRTAKRRPSEPPPAPAQTEPEPQPASDSAGPDEPVAKPAEATEQPAEAAAKPAKVAEKQPKQVASAAGGIPDWVKRRRTKCGTSGAKWYFNGYWRYHCAKS